MERRACASDSFELHVKVLVWCGYNAPRAVRPALRWLHALYRLLVLGVFAMYILQEIFYIVLVSDDLVVFARVMLLLLVHCAGFAKMTTYRMKLDTIQTIIHDFSEPLLNPNDDAARRTISQSVATSKFIVKVFVMLSFSTCMVWSAYPVVEYGRGQEVRFYYWLFDVDYNVSPNFEIMALYTAALTTLLAVANTALDALIVAVLAQCNTQLTILRHNLECLPAKCQDVKSAGEMAYNEALSRELAACIRHYEKIMQISEKFSNTFGAAIFFQFGCSGWIICMTAYKLANVSPNTAEFASLILFLSCMLTELFLFCYYGNEVKVESELLSQSAFIMSWPETPDAFRRSLIIVMERFKRPIVPVAGLIIPLSLETFVKVLKSSYTYYTVLKSRNRE